MAKWITAVTSRLGIILIVLGLFLIIRPFGKSHVALSRLLELNQSTYIGIGLLVAGAIIFAIFIYTFFKGEKKKTTSQAVAHTGN